MIVYCGGCGRMVAATVHQEEGTMARSALWVARLEHHYTPWNDPCPMSGQTQVLED